MPALPGDTEARKLADSLYYAIRAVLLESGLLGDTSPQDWVQLPTSEVIAQLKTLLPNPAASIELESQLSTVIDDLVMTLNDPELFPRIMPAPGGDLQRLRYLTNQAAKYLEVVDRLGQVLVYGVAYSNERHHLLWRRAIERVASQAEIDYSGDSALLGLRHLPTLILTYCILVAGVTRANYDAIRSALMESKARLFDRTAVPVIALANPWKPFRDAQLVPDILRHEYGREPLGDEDLQLLLLGRGQRYFAPVSSLLHDRLRDLFRDLIPDDADYTELFDQAEVLLSLLAEDASDDYAIGMGTPYGSYIWRGRNNWSSKSVEEQVAEVAMRAAPVWPPLTAGLFSGSRERLAPIIGRVLEGAAEARRHMH